VRQFADFGADVIKIESPPGVDPNEGMGGARTGSDFQNSRVSSLASGPALHSFHASPLLMVKSCSSVMASRSGVRRSASSGKRLRTELPRLGNLPSCWAIPTSRPMTLLLTERVS